MSHWRTLTKVDEFGMDFDAKTKEWKRNLEQSIERESVLNTICDVWYEETSSSGKSGTNVDASVIHQSTFQQPMDLASVDVEGELSNKESCSLVSLPVSHKLTCNLDEMKEKVKAKMGGKFNDDAFSKVEQHIKNQGSKCLTKKVLEEMKMSHGTCGYQITGDNLDFLIKVKHMSSQNQNNSIHLNGVINRVHGNHLSNNAPIKSILDVENADFLPSYQENLNFLHDMIPLVTRVAVSKIPAQLQNFKNVVVWHIPHTYSKEMKVKSSQVNISVMNQK
jgi:hypothetical protein